MKYLQNPNNNRNNVNHRVNKQTYKDKKPLYLIVIDTSSTQ